MLALAILPGAGQAPALRILSAGPAGELAQLADADQIRFVFSEPMVAPGSVLSGAAPPWIRFTPAVNGRFYWSGASTLILLPGYTAPLPYATRYTVRVDGSATSLAGRALGAPYKLTFTTPTVRLLSAEWYRRNDRFDSPAVIALRFNQPVRPEDVAAHVHVALTPHAWTAPPLEGRRSRAVAANGSGRARALRCEGGGRPPRDVEHGRSRCSSRRVVGRATIPARADPRRAGDDHRTAAGGLADRHHRRRDAEPRRQRDTARRTRRSSSWSPRSS